MKSIIMSKTINIFLNVIYFSYYNQLHVLWVSYKIKDTLIKISRQKLYIY